MPPVNLSLKLFHAYKDLFQEYNDAGINFASFS